MAQATGNAMRSARHLRQTMSLPEVLLWQQLRLVRRDIRFRRQHPIGPYVADFYCPAAKLVIEIDGGHHNHSQATDASRDAYLRDLGLRTLRIPASDVLTDPQAIADALLRLCDRTGPSVTGCAGATFPLLRNREDR